MKSESLIVKFFENTLSEEERKEFNALMNSDEDFKKEVTFRQELISAITLDDRETIKQELQALEQPKVNKKSRLLPMAASFLILIGISSFWFFGNQTTNPDDLFNTHFEPYRNVVQPIERGNVSQDTRIDAFAAYEQGNYDEALNNFDVLLANQKDAIIEFYKANSLMATGQTEQALKILESNLKTNDSLTEKHFWYLALAYIKTGQSDTAKIHLGQLIANPYSEYKKEEAKKLMTTL